MVTEKQKCIAEQAVYGDLMGYGLQDGYYKKNPSLLSGFQGQLVYIGCDVNKVDSIKPILRPLLDLTKEITHKGYNDDKPFIPLVELERLNSIPVDNTERALRYYDLLHLWHFDTRKLIATGEAISTDVVNPYEV